MEHIKNILKYSKEIVVTYIFSYLLIIILCIIYTLLGYQDLIKFINTTCIYISLIYYILTIIYLYRKNYMKEQSLPIKKYFPLISLGISLAILMNMIIFLMNSSQIVENNISPIIMVISSGVLGPILEEVLFRYLLYNRLKKVYSTKKAHFINISIFALIHLSPIKIIYAFILGSILTRVYEKNQNILAPILIHIAANSIVLLLSEYNIYILILSIISLIISIKLNFCNCE